MSAYGWEQLAEPEAEYGWQPTPDNQLLRITLGNLEGETRRPRKTDTGYLWGITDLTGWWEPAPDNTTTITTPGGHGQKPLRTRYAARPLTITGWIHAQTSPALQQGLDALADVGVGTLVVDELLRGVCREADVRVMGMQVSRRSDCQARVTVSLVADDPLRYSSGVVPLVGSTRLVNGGNARAFPLIDLVGPHGVLAISDGRATTRIAATPSGQKRTVDLVEGCVWRGATRVPDGLSGGLVSAAAGSATTWTVSGFGSGSAQVRRWEAWS